MPWLWTLLTSGHVAGAVTYAAVSHPDGTLDIVDLPTPVTITADVSGGDPNTEQWGSQYTDGDMRLSNQTVLRIRQAGGTIDGVPDFPMLTATQASLASSLTNEVTICRGTCPS